MGLSLFGGRLAAPPTASLSDVCVGARAYVRLPDDPLPAEYPGRPAVVRAVDSTRGGAGRIQVCGGRGGRATGEWWDDGSSDGQVVK